MVMLNQNRLTFSFSFGFLKLNIHINFDSTFCTKSLRNIQLCCILANLINHRNLMQNNNDEEKNTQNLFCRQNGSFLFLNDWGNKRNTCCFWQWNHKNMTQTQLIEFIRPNHVSNIDTYRIAEICFFGNSNNSSRQHFKSKEALETVIKLWIFNSNIIQY